MSLVKGNWVILGTVVVALMVAGGWALHAQVGPGSTPAVASSFSDTATRKLDDLLEREVTVPFAEETSLSDVAAHLARSLKVRIAFDPAALSRQDLFPEDVIQLQIEGPLRLKTALPLLFEQVGLTYRFIAEDNLLVLTDARGAGDPTREILDELRDLHRDLHDLQDAVDELRGDQMGEEGPSIRKPTLIEEVPPPPDDQPEKAKDRPRAG